MNAHLLLHIPFEGPANISDWLHERGATVTMTRFWESAALPALKTFDLLIIMGGCMSVNDEAEYPWLKAEKAFIREAIERGTPTLGICLGAQLMANALGARVYPNREKEIGLWEVEAVPAEGDVFCFPPRFHVMQWHGETFDIPEGAVKLARSEACENQAFQIGRRAVALQFHPEMTAESVEIMIQHCSDELAPATPVAAVADRGPAPAAHIQSAAALRALPPEAHACNHRLMSSLLDYLTR